VPRYVHELRDVAALLDAKIEKLRQLKADVEAKIHADSKAEKKHPVQNSEALRQISASLAHCLNAKHAMNESCCGMVCPIEYI
jgi:hypothetical protein